MNKPSITQDFGMSGSSDVGMEHWVYLPLIDCYIFDVVLACLN